MFDVHVIELCRLYYKNLQSSRFKLIKQLHESSWIEFYKKKNNMPKGMQKSVNNVIGSQIQDLGQGRYA